MPSRASLRAGIGVAKTSHGSSMAAVRLRCPPAPAPAAGRLRAWAEGRAPAPPPGGAGGGGGGVAGCVTGMWISRFGSPMRPMAAPRGLLLGGLATQVRKHILRDIADHVEGAGAVLAVESE